MSALVQQCLHWWNNANLRRRWTVIILIFSVVCTGLFFLLTASPSINESNPLLAHNDIDTPIYYIGTVLKTIGVLLLVVGGGVILKRTQNNRPGRFSDRKMTVLETTRLSPRQALHLVRVGDQDFLVGATDQNINLISPVYPIAASKVTETEISETVDDFNQLLNSAIVRPMKNTPSGNGLP